MVRYIFVAGVYAAAVLAAPAQNAAEVGAAPAGWGDNSPSLGSSLFGWARPNHNKPEAVAPEGGSSTLYTPSSSSSSRDWGTLFGGSRGDRGSKGGSGAGSSAPPSRDWGSLFGGSRGGSGADTSAPPKSSSGGGFFGGLFGGSSRPKPASSGSSSGSSWGGWPRPASPKPKPEWNPKPGSSEPTWPKTSEPKPESSESSEEDETSVSVPAPNPEPAQPNPEPAQPKPESDAAAPVPTPSEPELDSDTLGPEPAKPKPESAAPVPVPTPAEPKTEAGAVPKPTTGSSKSSCEAKGLEPDNDDIEKVRKRLWQPTIGSKWQIILDGVPDTRQPALKPDDAHVWDIDLWDATADDICNLKKQGKKVICYFSAGTSETWRHDNDKLKAFNKGPVQMDDNPKGKAWEGESWLDIRETQVRNVMSERIKMAANKGCDALDPDNMDGYDNVIKATPSSPQFKLTDNDSVKYMKFLADEAAKYGMSIGLKNSLTIIPKVKPYIQFAVNEECAKVKECQEYKELLTVKKPVFHIEYTGTSGTNRATTRTTYKDPSGATKKYCNPLREAVSRFSTIIKAGETLGNQYLYCDGKPADFTPMLKYIDKKGGKSKGNFVESEEEESSGFESNERFTNSTMFAEEESSNSTMVKKWRVKKRRHHRRAILVDIF